MSDLKYYTHICLQGVKAAMYSLADYSSKFEKQCLLDRNSIMCYRRLIAASYHGGLVSFPGLEFVVDKRTQMQASL